MHPGTKKVTRILNILLVYKINGLYLQHTWRMTRFLFALLVYCFSRIITSINNINMKKARRTLFMAESIIKTGIITSLLLLITATTFCQDNILIEVSGKVVNQEKNEPLSDVSVQIKGSVTGTITDNTGSFILRTKQKLPFTLV